LVLVSHFHSRIYHPSDFHSMPNKSFTLQFLNENKEQAGHDFSRWFL
jgi:hypothetical protein